MEWYWWIIMSIYWAASNYYAYRTGYFDSYAKTKKLLIKAKEIVLAQERQIAKLHEQCESKTVEFRICDVEDIDQYFHDQRN